MKMRALRFAATCAIVALLAACGSGADTSKPFSQEDFSKSLATYMTAAGTNFDGFTGDPALVGTSECSVDNAGKAGATTQCKVDVYESQADAMKSYTTWKDRIVKALPEDAKGGEQKDAAPNTPFRFVALSGKGGLVLGLTKFNGKWLVGYLFQKAPAS